MAWRPAEARIRVQATAELATAASALEDVRSLLCSQTSTDEGNAQGQRQTSRSTPNDPASIKPGAYEDMISAYRNGMPVRIRRHRRAVAGAREQSAGGMVHDKRAISLAVQSQTGAKVHQDGAASSAASAASGLAAQVRHDNIIRPHRDDQGIRLGTAVQLILTWRGGDGDLQSSWTGSGPT